MEDRTEFNLENNINLWKSNLVEKNVLTKDMIIELENHLIDSIDDLKSNGLNKEESFIIARKRIGTTDDICLEFNKVNSNYSLINKAIPYLKGALIYIAFVILIKLMLLTSLLLSDELNITSSTFNIITIIVLISITTSFLISIYFRKSFLNKLNKINVLITLIIISLGSILLLARMPLSGIDPLNASNKSLGLENHTIMENNFFIYKAVVLFIIFTVSLTLFWINKKQNKLNFVK